MSNADLLRRIERLEADVARLIEQTNTAWHQERQPAEPPHVVGSVFIESDPVTGRATEWTYHGHAHWSCAEMGDT